MITCVSDMNSTISLWIVTLLHVLTEIKLVRIIRTLSVYITLINDFVHIHDILKTSKTSILSWHCFFLYLFFLRKHSNSKLIESHKSVRPSLRGPKPPAYVNLIIKNVWSVMSFWPFILSKHDIWINILYNVTHDDKSLGTTLWYL